MQMIDVLKRLAELDAQNPNVVKENIEQNSDLIYISVDRVEDFEDWMESEGLDTSVPKQDEGTYVVYDYSNADHTSKMYADTWNEKRSVAEGLNECGMMGSEMSRPHTPATINMTADSGVELTGMLRDIMQLAGMKQVGAHDLGHEHDPAVLSTVPSVGMAKVDSEPFDMKSMIAKVDSLNDLDDEEDEESVKEWDNEPVKDVNGDMDNEAMLNKGMHNQDPAGTPGAAAGRNLKNHPVATPEETYESLMTEYQKFINEDMN